MRQLLCRYEAVIWIAAEIRWKPVIPDALNVTVDATQALADDENTGLRIAEFDLEITLTNHPTVQRARGINEKRLTDAAFLPKNYTLKLEKGFFFAPWDAEDPIYMAKGRKFEWRITFDHSPFPPEEQWRKARGGPGAFKFWDMKEFVRQRIPASDH